MKLIPLSLLLPAVTALPTSPWTNPHPNPPTYPGLDTLAKHAGLSYFGTAIDNVALNNPRYTSIAHNRSEFGQVTPSNGQKWMYTEPHPNKFNYTLGDQITVPGKKAGQLRRCHTFAWHNQLPAWVTGRNWTKGELVGVLENHIRNEAGHYYDECYAWDVGEYIEMAFRFARRYTSPRTKLYYNDYGIERVNNKSTAVAALVEDFIERDVPIDGVGLQAHYTVGRAPTYDDQKAALKLFTKLGVETALTELDVRIELPDDSTKQAIQAAVYANSTKACVDVDDCVGITVWDFWDPVSWVPDTFPGYGNADLWDANFTKKPAYYAISDLLKTYD